MLDPPIGQPLASNVPVLIVMASVLGVPVAIVLVVVVVAVLPRLMPAGRRVDVRVLVLMHAVVRVVDHPGYLLHRPSRRLSEAHSPCHFLLTDDRKTRCGIGSTRPGSCCPGCA